MDFSFVLLQADVEVSFKVKNFKKAQILKPQYWENPQLLCSQKGTATTKGGVGPFGLLVLASNDFKEYTSVSFTIFKKQGKYVVLMCSDQSRYDRLFKGSEQQYRNDGLL